MIRSGPIIARRSPRIWTVIGRRFARNGIIWGSLVIPKISYTLPCHRREADLFTVLPSIIAAANASPPVEIVIVDYGNPEVLAPRVWPWLRECREGVSLVVPRIERDFFHMAHARN